MAIGQHARDHRHRRHDDRLGALVAGVDDRLVLGHALADLLDREVDEEDRVLGDDPEQHEQADHHRKRHRIAGEVERERSAQRREQQRAHVDEGRKHPLVEQDQHREDQEDPGDDGEDEVADQLRLPFGGSDLHLLDAVGKVLDRRQGLDLLHRVAGDDPGREIGADRGAAALVVAFDLARPGAEADLGDMLERHRAAAGGRHRQILDGREVSPRVFGQGDPDRHLAVGQREFGAVLVDVAQGRDPDRLAERRGGHSEVGGEVEPRLDRDLGPLQLAVDPRRPDLRAAGASRR